MKVAFIHVVARSIPIIIICNVERSQIILQFDN